MNLFNSNCSTFTYIRKLLKYATNYYENNTLNNEKDIKTSFKIIIVKQLNNKLKVLYINYKKSLLKQQKNFIMTTRARLGFIEV